MRGLVAEEADGVGCASRSGRRVWSAVQAGAALAARQPVDDGAEGTQRRLDAPQLRADERDLLLDCANVRGQLGEGLQPVRKPREHALERAEVAQFGRQAGKVAEWAALRDELFDGPVLPEQAVERTVGLNPDPPIG